MAEYEKYHLEFVCSDNVHHPTARKNEKGEWEMALPSRYEYPIQSVMLRCVEEILKIEGDEYGKTIVLGSDSQTEIPDGASLMRRRVDIAARGFQANMKLGKKYGWSLEGYELAKNYHQDYEDGIREAWKKGSIGKDTSREDLWKIAHEHATSKLLETLVPPEGVPRVFFPLHAVTYFEEFNIKEKARKCKKPGHPDHIYLVAEPIELGSPAFDTLMEEMSRKKEISDRKSSKYTTLNVVITPNKKILVLPRLSSQGEQSQHSIVAKGNPSAWAGEVIIEGKRVTKINDRSGHFMTIDYDEKVQEDISNFALQTFREQGYHVPSGVELYRKTVTP